MSKALKVIGTIAAVVAMVATAIPTGGASLAIGAALGVSLGTIATVGMVVSGLAMLGSSLLAPRPKAPTVSRASADRLFASINASAPRTIVFGKTAMATDIRDQELTDSQTYLHRFIVVASHKVHAIREMWLDDKLAWTASGGVTGEYAGYLTATPVLEGSAGNAINISARMGATRRYTGCAYLYLRFKLTGNAKNVDSPFAQSIPSRMTIVGDGAYVYDPRLDSTAGGSGPQRANDQTTWAWSDDASRNPALELLWYLLGWRIQNPVTSEWKLAVGKGIPAARIDLASFITAANLCDEAVSIAAGGTEPRYRSDGVFSEADDPTVVLDGLKAAMNAVLDDVDGRIRIMVLHNDLSPAVGALSEDDVLGEFQFEQTPPLNDTFNVIRGGYTDPSTVSLYQLVDYPEVAIESPDGIERVETVNLPMVQSASQAQRLVKQRLARLQYSSTFAATFKATAWRYQKGDVIDFNFALLGWVGEKFRIVETSVQVDGTVPMILRREHEDIYAWDASDAAPVAGVAPITYDAALDPIRRRLILLAQAVERGAYDPGETYVEGNIVSLPDGSRWLFIDETPTAGSMPSDANPLWSLVQGEFEAIVGENVFDDTGYLLPKADLITNLGISLGFLGQGPGATAPAWQVFNNSLGSGVLRIPSPGGGSYFNGTPGLTGCIKIKLPIGFHDLFMRYKVEIYNYVAQSLSTYEIGGYAYGYTSTWINCTASMVGSDAARRRVRFARDGGGYACVWIGEDTDTWSYPSIRVIDFQASDATGWQASLENGWEVSLGAYDGGSVHADIAKPTAGEAVYGLNILEGPGVAATLSAFKTLLGIAAGFTGQGPGATAPGSAVLNNEYTGYSLRIPAPVGGAYSHAAVITGALKIKLPTAFLDTMVRFTIEIYEYGTALSSTYEVGGYTAHAGGVGLWINVFASMTGADTARRPVRFGRDAGGHPCVWIGEAANNWSYPQVRVTNFIAGYANFSEAQWATGWELSVVNPITSIDVVIHETVAVPHAGEARYGANLLESPGVPATLTAFKTTLGIASAVAGQGALATLNSLALGGSQLTGFGGLAAISYVQFGSTTVRTEGGVTVTDSIAVTAIGIAAGFTGQGALATEDNVGTGTIQANAVTQPASFYDNSSVGQFGTNDWVELASRSITVLAGSTVFAAPSCAYEGSTTAGVSDLSVRVTRNGTVIWGPAKITGTYYYDNAFMILISQFSGVLGFGVQDQPGAGTHTYKLEMSCQNANYGATSFGASGRSMVLTEFKR